MKFTLQEYLLNLFETLWVSIKNITSVLTLISLQFPLDNCEELLIRHSDIKFRFIYSFIFREYFEIVFFFKLSQFFKLFISLLNEFFLLLVEDIPQLLGPLCLQGQSFCDNRFDMEMWNIIISTELLTKIGFSYSWLALYKYLDGFESMEEIELVNN